MNFSLTKCSILVTHVENVSLCLQAVGIELTGRQAGRLLETVRPWGDIPRWLLLASEHVAHNDKRTNENSSPCLHISPYVWPSPWCFHGYVHQGFHTYTATQCDTEPHKEHSASFTFYQANKTKLPIKHPSHYSKMFLLTTFHITTASTTSPGSQPPTLAMLAVALATISIQREESDSTLVCLSTLHYSCLFWKEKENMIETC